MTGAAPAAHIAIAGAAKRFGDGRTAVHAFGPASLEIAAGEFVSLVGPSGCGKSTLLLMIAGLMAPSDGTISVGSQPAGGARADIGIMFQDSTLVPWRSVRGNIELQLELRGRRPAEYRDRIDALLDSVGLADFASHRPYQLSGGMQQRAALCQAMAHEPATLLLDEPLGKLDAMTRERIRGDLQSLWLRARPTVLLVTHSIEEAVQLSSRICIVTPRPGRLHSVVDIDLPWPRDAAVRKSAAFSAYVNDIGDVFRGFGVI